MYFGYANKKEILSDYADFVSKGKVAFFKKFRMDVVMGKREGIYFYDIESDKRLINCHCNGGVFNLGHRNPDILSALQNGMQDFDIGNHHLISAARARLGAKLAELTPGKISKTVFGVGGGEAVDLALKLAMGHTQRPKIISAQGGYHGHTGLALAAGHEQFRKRFGIHLNNFTFNDIPALDKAIDDQTAAVILEPIPATLGMVIPDDDYLPAVQKLCNDRGALFIIDEVQTGLGRTGRLWAVENWNVEPDILVIGKGLSGGLYPITATCFKPDLEKIFLEDPFIHISTFGGSEVGCFPALKVLEISSQPEFLTHVNELADHFSEGFRQIAARVTKPKFTVRQKGLMIGLKFDAPLKAMALSKLLYDNGIFAVFSGNDPSVVQFLPPLITTLNQADDILTILEKSISDLNSLKTKMMMQAVKFFVRDL
ncbi:MAG: aspartate aminotransferase family protein [Calditrichaeota bacterium]|nr:aspartate aminotransferase family protein [Calditrichota bacterium]